MPTTQHFIYENCMGEQLRGAPFLKNLIHGLRKGLYKYGRFAL
jgi:hypothetical protein